MPYVLGIDVGTSCTAAATCALSPETNNVDVVRLGGRRATVPSVLHISQDGTFIVGDAAEQRAPVDPGRIARDFARRVGDDVPLVVSGGPATAEELTAALVTWVLQHVESQYGYPPERIVLTHPAGWGPYRRGLLHQALWRSGLTRVTLLPEPIAAGESHASREAAEPGSAYAVYGLGRDTFESAVIRRAEGGTFELLYSGETVENLGGAHFDDAMFDHVRGQLGRRWADPDPADPRSRPNMARLWYECAAAKVRLSTAAEAAVPVPVPQGVAQVRVNRTEFEDLIRADVESTVDSLLRTVRLSPVEPDELEAVLLVGGGARIPLVAELVSAALPCEVAPNPDPDLAPAMGAALAGVRLMTAPESSRAARQPSIEETSVLVATRGEVDRYGDSFEEPPPRPVVDITPLELPEKRRVLKFLPGFRANALGAMLIAVIALGLMLASAPHPGSATFRPAAPAPAALAGRSGGTAPIRAGLGTSASPAPANQTQPRVDRPGDNDDHEDAR